MRKLMSSSVKILNNPPIKEAIFAISFKERISNEELGKFAQDSKIKELFPVFNEGRVFEISNRSDSDDPGSNKISASEKQEGFILRDKENKDRLLQVNPTIISYHNFNSYAGWDVMIDELKVIWGIFKDSVGLKVSQISVRYINHIALPFPLSGGLSNYTKLLPQVPKGINSSLNNFFVQINTSNEEKDLIGIITETILPEHLKRNEIVLLIDVSVVCQKEYNTSNQEIWDSFVKIRKYKDDLFFSCITEETEKLFN